MSENILLNEKKIKDPLFVIIKSIFAIDLEILKRKGTADYDWALKHYAEFGWEDVLIETPIKAPEGEDYDWLASLVIRNNGYYRKNIPIDSVGLNVIMKGYGKEVIEYTTLDELSAIVDAKEPLDTLLFNTANGTYSVIVNEADLTEEHIKSVVLDSIVFTSIKVDMVQRTILITDPSIMNESIKIVTV